MRIQNLNENRTGDVIGAMFWHGRSWHEVARRELKLEWCFGKHATQCHARVVLGADENNDGIQVTLSIPRLFSIYATVCGLGKWTREYEFGFSIHGCAIWLYTGCDRMGGWSQKMPWWDKSHSWDFPWQLTHYKTEILEHKANLPFLAKTVWEEVSRKGVKKNIFDRMKERESAEKSVSKKYAFRYLLKNGDVQDRMATVHVHRMTWRARWWPLIWRNKVSTTISVNFDAEVGEGTGSWKGGVVGCGEEMLFGETPRETLDRMMLTRKFGR